MSPSALGHQVADRLIEATKEFLKRYSDDALGEISLQVISISYVFDGTFCDSFLDQLLTALRNINHVLILLRSDQMENYQMDSLRDGLSRLAREYHVSFGVLSSPSVHAKGVGIFLRAPFYKDKLGVVAAVGSMNFTVSGMHKTHEMMVILRDQRSIHRFFQTFLKMLGKNKGTFLYMIDERGMIRKTPLKRS
jgi:phosphatidylserine/phosphatidylglycerophosphate/cardiolipin synthase-like enzyme